MAQNLKGKTAFVTGAGRGIGRAVAEALANEGVTVGLLARTEAQVKEVAEAITKNGGKAAFATADVTNQSEVEAAIATLTDTIGQADILINNAGLAASGPTYNFDDETFDRIIAINVKGVYVCSKKAINLMKENGGGCIINTSSMVSRVGTPGAIVYPGSKFAVDGMTISLAREVGKDNIRVNCVAPGITETDMMAQAPKEIIAAMSKQVPLQRLGQPEDIANAFVFLASDYASYITGAVLRVDGGMLG